MGLGIWILGEFGILNFGIEGNSILGSCELRHFEF